MKISVHAFAVFMMFAIASSVSAQTAAPSVGVTRTYYVAADEVDWDYMPHGMDGMMGMKPIGGYAKFYATKAPHLIGHVYRKAVYREYTDATFAHLKPRPPTERYLGILGPILHAEVGDTISVVFKNNGTHPYSMHPHGVFYQKASEGSAYADGVNPPDKGGDSVAPGKTFTYEWNVPERAGPGPSDPSSIVWLYHSHVNERRDVNAGLVGAIVVTRAGMARADGTPKDVDREFVMFMMIFDENTSGLIAYNIEHFVSDKKKFNRTESVPFDPLGNYDPLAGTGFASQNFRSTINGYSYADGPMMEMKKGDRVRWYVVSLGEGINQHTPHWHGNTVLYDGHRTDLLYMGPASMLTADMVPDDPGTWLFHCHFSDHMEGGMSARYHVAEN